jgi:hypothetical protein
MVAKRRNILGPSADNGMPNAAAADGGDTSLDRAPGYAAVVKLGDQQSPQTAGERASLVDTYTATKGAASQFEGAGAYGIALGRNAEG